METGINSSESTDALSRYQVSPEPQTKLSLQQIAALPVEQRHKLLAQSIATTAEDFFKDPSLTEFSVLDGEDWDTGND